MAQNTKGWILFWLSITWAGLSVFGLVLAVFNVQEQTKLMAEQARITKAGQLQAVSRQVVGLVAQASTTDADMRGLLLKYQLISPEAASASPSASATSLPEKH